MGVPVVTLVGDRHMARVGASLMAAIGHTEWTTVSEQAYVACAVALAADFGAISAVRANLRGDLLRSPLLDHATQAARFGIALRECWKNWCRTQTPAAAPNSAQAVSVLA